ncbi:MAG: signal peptidase II [Solirubrobacterales bacterium]
MKIGRHIAIDKAAVTAFVVVVLDQLTKQWAFSATTPGGDIDLFFGFSIGQTRNEGIAFGFFSGRPWIVYGLMAVALSVLVWFYLRHRSRPVLWLATGLLLGGAIGNAIDRLSLGYVRDFIDFPSFPSFNVADIAITFGVVILVLTAERQDDFEEPSLPLEEDAPERTL